MVSDLSLIAFPTNCQAPIIGSTKNLEEGDYRLLAVKHAEPRRCYSELLSFGASGDDQEDAQKRLSLQDLVGRGRYTVWKFANATADVALIGWECCA